MRTVTVTIDDLRKGRARHPYFCALALAFQRAVPEAHTVTVDGWNGRVVLSRYVAKHKQWTRDLMLPDKAIRFCRGEWLPKEYGRPGPLTFTIDVYI